MTEFPLPLPLGGVSDDMAFGKQSRATSREIRNMRPNDPENGRERLSYRSGQSKACAFPIDAGVPVAEIVSTVFDARNLVYSQANGAATEEWAKALPSNVNSVAGVTDTDGNLYVLDGQTSVVKMNQDGKVIWQFPLPTQDTSLAARFVTVDDLFDVYVGLSSGSRQNKGRLWKLTQIPEDKVEIAWEVELTSYVETAVVRQDKLYTLQNEPDTKSAFVRVYSSLDAAAPKLTQEWRVAYPANDMDVDAAGNVFVASDQEGTTGVGGVDVALRRQRGPTPRFPRLAPFGEEWTPWKLVDIDKRCWSWFEADDLTEFDVLGPYADGVAIRRWPERSGHFRHLYAPLSPLKPPTLAVRACLQHNAIRFNGVDQLLTSLPNPSIDKDFADQQRTVLPAYTGSMFCSILVMRAERRTAGNPMFVFGQGNSAAGASDHILIANRLPGAALPGAMNPGLISWFASTDAADPGQGAGGHPIQGAIDTFGGISILVLLWDGGIDPGVSLVKTRSLWQDRGYPRDRFLGLGNTTLLPTLVGMWTTPSAGIDFFRGDLLAWFTLDRINREDDLTEPKLLTHDALEAGDPDVPQTDNELTRLVGYFAHRFGMQGRLPSDIRPPFAHPYGPVVVTIGAAEIQRAGPPLAGRLGPVARVQRKFACLAKYSAQGTAVWTLNGEDLDPDHPTKQVSGVGYGVRCGPTGSVFSIGPEETGDWNNPSSRHMRKVIDLGATFSLLVADGAWTATIGDPSYKYPRMTVDTFGNVYVPLTDTAETTLRVFNGATGALLSAVTVGSPASAVFAVAIDPKVPDYRTDLTVKMARFVYAMGQIPTPIHKIRLVQQTPITGSPRQIVNLAINKAGVIKTFEVGGALGTPAGAAGALSATPVFVQATSLLGKVYITDGVGDIVVFDPILNTISKLVSTTPGEPAKACKILEAWNGRLVMARSPDLINGAFNWLMSAQGEPTAYDTSPPEKRNSAAIGGSNSDGPGLVPDIVNAFIPYSDDLGIWGCDHSIYRMTGDPGEGGTFDLVQGSVMGMAIGRPHCKGPGGAIWFVGTRGGLFYWPSSGLPERVSLKNIDQRLTGIDFSTHTVRLVWNDADQGLHIFRVPLGTPGDPVEHYFWSQKRGNSAWPDTFEASVEPTCCYVVDGDEPADRVLLLGGRDGFIRKWDAAAGDDDGQAIDRSVLVGPLVNSDAAREQRFTGPRAVLATDLDGCSYELFATDDPAVLGPPRHSGELGPGRNPTMRTGMRGSYCFVRLFNRQIGQRFAIEEIAMMAHAAGAKRVREGP